MDQTEEQAAANELSDAADSLHGVLGAFMGYEPHGTVLGEWSDGNRKVMLALLRHSNAPRVTLSLWNRNDQGTWTPVRYGQFIFRMCELVGFARAVAKALGAARSAAVEARRREREQPPIPARDRTGDVHMRARAEANAEADEKSA